MSEWFQSILNAFKAPREEVPQFPPNAPYPSREDLDLARRSGFGYETGNDEIYKTGPHTNVPVPSRGSGLRSLDEFFDKRIIPEMKNKRNLHRGRSVADMQLAAGLAANRSGITGLGYDPRRFSVDTRPTRANYGGLYAPNEDVGWVRLEDPSALTHEATHRGLAKLREQDSPTARKIDGLDEELLVRHIMTSRMGDPEDTEDQSEQRKQAIDRYSGTDKETGRHLRVYDQLEREAREAVAARRPWGMR
jgi:hypothetical protein